MMNKFYENRLVRMAGAGSGGPAEGHGMPTNALEGAAVAVASDVQKALDAGATMVAGVKVPTPEEASENLEAAFTDVKSVFGSKFNVSLDDIYFQKFRGNIVGESKDKGVFVDPVMLMHPSKRLAHVIAHETAHDRRRVMNEALVESYVALWFGADGSEGVYEAAVENFGKLAKLFDRKGESEGDAKKGTERMYELYYTNNPQGLYTELMEGLSEEDQDEAHDLFKKVFPEIEYVHHDRPIDDPEFVDGECKIKVLKPEEYELTSQVREKVEATVAAVEGKEPKSQ